MVVFLPLHLIDDEAILLDRKVAVLTVSSCMYKGVHCKRKRKVFGFFAGFRMDDSTQY